MALSLAVHLVNSIHSSGKTSLDDTALAVNIGELRDYLLEDRRLESIDLKIVHPGDGCRVGYVFDVLEPRAKTPGDGPDFPGILGPLAPVGRVPPTFSGARRSPWWTAGNQGESWATRPEGAEYRRSWK